jgi:hypothetical protein
MDMHHSGRQPLRQNGNKLPTPTAVREECANESKSRMYCPPEVIVLQESCVLTPVKLAGLVDGGGGGGEKNGSPLSGTLPAAPSAIGAKAPAVGKIPGGRMSAAPAAACHERRRWGYMDQRRCCNQQPC